MDRRLVVICVPGSLLLAGCSGDSPGSTPSPTTEGTPTPTDAPTESTSATSDPPASGELEVHFINVDQSVSTLIIAPSGETMLVDTGDFTDDGEFVLQYLRRHDIQRIDYLVTTHNDADHIGGNAAVIEYYETQADGCLPTAVSLRLVGGCCLPSFTCSIHPPPPSETPNGDGTNTKRLVHGGTVRGRNDADRVLR